MCAMKLPTCFLRWQLLATWARCGVWWVSTAPRKMGTGSCLNPPFRKEFCPYKENQWFILWGLGDKQKVRPQRWWCLRTDSPLTKSCCEDGRYWKATGAAEIETGVQTYPKNSEIFWIGFLFIVTYIYIYIYSREIIWRSRQRYSHQRLVRIESQGIPINKQTLRFCGSSSPETPSYDIAGWQRFVFTVPAAANDGVQGSRIVYGNVQLILDPGE